MTGQITKRFLDAYYQRDENPLMFLTGFFRSPAKNFFASEKVELDIVRSGREIAIAVQDLSVGYRDNQATVYTNKEFTPAIYKEQVPLDSGSLIKRMANEHSFVNPNYLKNIRVLLNDAMQEIQRKIQRAIEVQASQVLQTGALTLTDATGASVFALNYQPKTTHFPTAGTSWATATGEQMLNDLQSLADVITTDGLREPNVLIMGSSSFNKLIRNDDVKSLFDNRRYELGTINGATVAGNGGIRQGSISIGNYRFDIWTYNGEYTNPANGNPVKYIDKGKIIVTSYEARFDAVFGDIPNIGVLLGASRNNILDSSTRRFSSSNRRMDLFTNVWLSDNGEQIFAGVGSRPLLIPTAIDQYGCLTTGL